IALQASVICIRNPEPSLHRPQPPFETISFPTRLSRPRPSDCPPWRHTPPRRKAPVADPLRVIVFPVRSIWSATPGGPPCVTSARSTPEPPLPEIVFRLIVTRRIG